MALSGYMQIDMTRIIEESEEVTDRKSHPFHLSAKKVSKFKGNCDKIGRKNALILESFMDQFNEYIEKAHPEKPKKK